MKSQHFSMHTSHESTEYYTPPYYVELAREVMGSIDLDPASCKQAQEIVNAINYFDEEANGLLRPWYGNIFLNPPYSEVSRRDKDGNSIPLPQWYIDVCGKFDLPLNTKNQELWSIYLRHQFYKGNVKQAILLTKAALGYSWFTRLFRSHPCVLTYDRIQFLTPDGEAKGKSKVTSAFFYFGPHKEKFKYFFSGIGRYTES